MFVKIGAINMLLLRSKLACYARDDVAESFALK